MRLKKFEKHYKYFQSMAFVLELYRQGIIDKDDYLKMEEYLGAKYGLEDNSIFRLHYKERIEW